MSTTPPDPLQLLRQLEARKLVSRASELLGAGVAAAQPPAPPAPPLRSPGLRRMYPTAQPIGTEGLCHRVRTTALIDGRPTRQGFVCPLLGDATAVLPSPAELAALTGEPAWADLALDEIAFIDTETTGLAGGSGTCAFLVGVGRLVAEPAAPGGYVFQLDQWFLEDYGGEPALLDALEAAFGDARAVVSYNGASFDVPLLETRWRMHRRRPPLPALHLDLLRYTRRLWKQRLDSCSLGSIEQAILGLRRVGDVPGALVPRIYFDYLEGRAPERIVGVFDHHAQDVLSLGALLGVVAQAWREPQGPRFTHAGEQWGLSRWLAQRGRAEEALACMEAAVLAARDEDFGFRLAMHLARAYRRAGRVDDALAIWEARRQQCDAARPERLEALIELAKHAEHARRDAAAALQLVEEAMAILARVSYPPPPRAVRLDAELQRRQTRLLARIAALRNA